MFDIDELQKELNDYFKGKDARDIIEDLIESGLIEAFKENEMETDSTT